MHEMGIVRRLLNQVLDVQVAHGGAVREIRVQVGPLSGVEPELMVSAFQQLREEASLPDATLTIEVVDLAARCVACASEFLPMHFRFRCPTCGASETEIIQGEGVILESVSLEQPLHGATS